MFRRHRFHAIAVAALLLAGSAGLVRGDVPGNVLHEFVPADPKEDIELAATTVDGSMPAAIDTPSGLVLAPDTSRLPTANEHSYGGSATSRSSDRTYRPDNDTRRPHVSRYDDPFSPSTTPYKRLRAFDMVQPDFNLGVADTTLRPVPLGGAFGSLDDRFYGDITLGVVPGEAVLVPTVGPGARILRMSTVPPLVVQIVRDSAENWYATSPVRARVRLVVQLAAPHLAFGGAIRPATAGRLPPVPPVPAEVRRAVMEVARTIGVASTPPSETIPKLVAWFRSFEPSEEWPRGKENVYLDLALSKKGVCRHRAYAFTVTALGLGIPTRMVINEAHAWVEINDGSLWRRIDLGGAAANLEDERGAERPPHVPAEDPFPWPAQTDSGQDSARRMRDRRQPGSGPTGGSGSPTGAPAPASPNSPGNPPPSYADRSTLPATTMAVTNADMRVMRGMTLKVEGTAATVAGPCGHVRVDVLFRDTKTGKETVVGALSTDESGRYRGSVVVPLEVPVGDYELLVSTPGDDRCGPGRMNP